MNIWALHGFLGLPSDWDFLADSCRNSGINLIKENLWSEPGAELELWDWARAFNLKVQRIKGPHVLMGYSMGGRLAMHALLDQPENWRGAMIVSSHTGLSDFQEKEKRRASDCFWSTCFLNDPWENVLEKWNSQPVFSGDSGLERNQKDFDENTLSISLRKWSLSNQDDLKFRLKDVSKPIKWVCGSNDQKFFRHFSDLKKMFAGKANFSFQELPGGHRVPWQSPTEFTDEVLSFVDSLST